MTTVNLETGEIVEDVQRPTLDVLVDRGVSVKREAAILKDNLAVIASQAKALYGVSKRDFNAFVKYSFEASIDEDIGELQALQQKLQSLGDNSSQQDLFESEDD